MLLGGFGALIFECSSRRIHSYEDLKVNNSGRYAEHGVHLELPILEFTGPGLCEVSFKMNFNSSWGGGRSPETSLLLLRQYVRYGSVAPLVTGGKPVGMDFNLWVCTGTGEAHKYYDGRGQMFGAEVDVTLKEYRLILRSNVI
jgi:phage protein U